MNGVGLIHWISLLLTCYIFAHAQAYFSDLFHKPFVGARFLWEAIRFNDRKNGFQV